jgi:hypothetical protein
MDIDAWQPGGPEHLHVAAIVLEGDPEIETFPAELLDGVFLELPGHGVVAALSHEERIPADAVALQPGLGEGVDPGGSPGEEDDPQGGIEQVEEDLDLLDDRVLAAGVEESPPVTAGVLDVMLAAGGV